MREVRLSTESWELQFPFLITNHVFTGVQVMYARITENGASGHGEGAGVYYFSETGESMLAQAESVREALERGADREELRDLLPAGGARNAIDCALWDLAAMREGKSIWELTGMEDISNTRIIAGVMVRGRWLSRETLQGMLDELAAKYAAQAQGVVSMEPVTLATFGLQGLAPAGWKELEPGVFARGNPDVDPTILWQMSDSGKTSQELALSVLGRFGVNELPSEPFGNHVSAALSWTLYQLESPMAPMALGLADLDGTGYMVLLAAPGEEMDALAKSVFFPAINALAPIN